MMLAACEYHEPELTISHERIVMRVGESTPLKVDVKKNSATTIHVNYEYNDSRDSEKPVFEISDFEGKSTTIQALNPGIDTLMVGYIYVVGISAQGKPFESIVVEVLEK